MRKVTILASLLLLAPAASQAKTLDDLLVEKGVITKAEAQAAGGSTTSKSYWKDGSVFEFPDSGFTAKINTFMQTRYAFIDNDEGAGKKNTSGFSVTKARIYVTGTAMHEEFKYYLDGDFVGVKGADGAQSTELKDAWLQWNACDWASLKMGQYKTQVSRQFNTSDHAIQFADRSVASDFFSLGRSQGLTASAKTDDGAWMGSAAIFNGLSDGEGINRGGVDTKHTGIAAVRWNAMGKMNSFEEGDIDFTDEMAVSLGAAYGYTEAMQAAAGGNVKQTNISVDGNMKYKGWSVHGEYFYENYDPEVDGADSQKPMGFYAQVGYFLEPKKWEVAGRYGLLDCDDGKAQNGMCKGNEKVNEVAVGLNYFWWRHALKAQLNFVHLNERVLGDGEDVNTNKWIFQLSSFF
jgi:phosphate-selective porin